MPIARLRACGSGDSPGSEIWNSVIRRAPPRRSASQVLGELRRGSAVRARAHAPPADRRRRAARSTLGAQLARRRRATSVEQRGERRARRARPRASSAASRRSSCRVRNATGSAVSVSAVASTPRNVQQVSARATGSLQRPVRLVDARRRLQREPLLRVAGRGVAVGMHVALQCAIGVLERRRVDAKRGGSPNSSK